MSSSAQYVRMAMTLKILQVLIILHRKIYNFTKDNSTHGNFVQGQLATNGNFVQIQSCLSLQGLVKVIHPLVGVAWDNSTKSNFAQIQLCPFPPLHNYT